MEYFDYEADRPALEYNFRQRIKSLKNMLGSNDSIVEVGCAYGYFLNLVKGDVKSHIGFDVSKDGVRFAKKELGVNATTADFLTHKFKKNSVDSIFMWDVAEHLAYPDAYFKKVAEILKPGGQVALTTGNINALLPKLRKGGWRMIHPPTHVYYFSPKTIARLLARHGLMVETVKHRSVSRNVGSVFNQIIGNRKALNKSTRLHSIGHAITTKTKLDKLNIPINTFDIMEVIARKA
jgi:2-polyprenyl-3-methyl-5-hydroxy-6-metoxy-1,4-benzoquinol methylase